MLELPETLNDFRLQGTFFNATLLLWRRAQELDDRNAPQVQPALRLLNGRKKKRFERVKVFCGRREAAAASLVS